MTASTHAFTMNGRISGELKSRADAEDEIRRRVGLLDGSERYSLSLWTIPPDVPFDKLDLETWPREYVQATGTSERMIAEMRVLSSRGAEHFAIGRADGMSGHASMNEVVDWNGNQTVVRSSEVLTENEVVEIFVSYFRQGGVPAGFSLRPL